MTASPLVDCVSLARERSRLHLDAARADELGPSARFFPEEPGEVAGSETGRLGTLRGELLPDVGSRERPDDVLAQGFDGLLRRPLRERESEPVGDEVVDALLERGRHAWKGGRALRRAHREAPRLAAPDGPERRPPGRDDEVDLPRLERDARVAYALVVHVPDMHQRVP